MRQGKKLLLLIIHFVLFINLLIIYCKFYNRKRLRIQRRNIVFLPCFAHQINLCVGDIFKVSPELKSTSQQALKIAVYFKNANNKYFIGNLRKIQMEIYGKCIQPSVPGDTRWNSYFNCCKSLIATKNALRVN